MSSQNAVPTKLMPIYQCDPSVHQTLRSVSDHLQQLCTHHVNHLVKVETMDGDVFEGFILQCDRGIVYLRLSNEGSAHRFFPGSPGPTSSFVLPLVLFNLLTISLL